MTPAFCFQCGMLWAEITSPDMREARPCAVRLAATSVANKPPLLSRLPELWLLRSQVHNTALSVSQMRSLLFCMHHRRWCSLLHSCHRRDHSAQSEIIFPWWRWIISFTLRLLYPNVQIFQYHLIVEWIPELWRKGKFLPLPDELQSSSSSSRNMSFM
jgi:hypothetical protein